MNDPKGRREFLQLLGLGGVVFASGLAGACSKILRKSAGPEDDFFFVQLSDTHWGFKGPPNPEAANTLRQAVQAVNALPIQPDFVVFTGDLTHTTDDDAERRKRMREFKAIVADLKTPVRRYMPGEHDASLDQGKAFEEQFGATRYSFDHKGIHFAVIDNVSDPQAALGDKQLDWLHADLKPLPAEAPIVVFTHRPLFDLAPQWDWATKDGSKAIDLLQQWKNVTVFYGHIHQEHHFRTGAIAHHAARSLIFPLPAPLSQPKRAPVPWDPMHPRRGLGFREIGVDESRLVLTLKEDSLEGAPTAQPAAAIGSF
ncbi:MAG: metallophosphoesterase [Deltaproteobacteria bacterium]|nr:MAG: metallophosphoesterase [Deltaproteobacteria bacterium]